jgi:hypothetical protein
MLARMKSRLSYANVVATLALVVAISGGATAIAITAGKNTVTTKSIKPGNVTARDLGPIKTVVETATLPSGTGASVSIRVECPNGTRALSGGGAGPGGDAAIQVSLPTPNGWQVGIGRTGSGGGSPVPVTGYAVCLERKPGKPANR